MRYVVIGGAATQARGWPEPTDDIDVTPTMDGQGADSRDRLLQGASQWLPELTTKSVS